MIKKFLISMCLIFSAAVVSVSAEEGYIFQLKDGTILPYSLTDGVESVVSEDLIYKADSLEDVYNFVNKSAIKYIGKDARVYLFDDDDYDGKEEPNDTYYKRYQWNIPQINIMPVWQKGYRGKGATVGIIDSGLNVHHEDLNKDNIISTYNITDNNTDITDFSGYEYYRDNNGEYILDEEKQEYVLIENDEAVEEGTQRYKRRKVGHGTFVTSIIAAKINNQKGIAGIADKVNIVAVKAFDGEYKTTTSDLIAALEKLEKENIDVINMSLGTTDKLDEGVKKMFEEKIDAFVEKGGIVIAAVGNNGNETMSYPAGFNNVIGVGGVAKNKNKCDFSQMNESVFIVAPGGAENGQDERGYLVSLAREGTDANGIIGGSGTSFAAPHVSAVAAIAKSIYPALTTDQFKEILIATSEDLGGEERKGYDTYYGYGLIDADKIISEVEKLASSTPEPTSAPTAEPTSAPTEKPEFTFNPDNYRKLSYENSKIIVETDDSEAVVYAAEFDGLALKSLKMFKISELDKTGDGSYEMSIENMMPTKLFLWHGIQSCIASWVDEDYVIPTAEPTATPYPYEEDEQTLVNLINSARIEAGVDALEVNETGVSVSRYLAMDMLEKGYMLNEEGKDINGKHPADYISEQSGWASVMPISVNNGTYGTTPEAIMDALAKSSQFSKVLDAEFTDIGIGLVRDRESNKSIWMINLFFYIG